MNKTCLQWGMLAAMALALGGCTGSDVRQSLGMKRNQPDEFQVVSRPPLSVPPVYYLKPPTEDETASVPADQQAKSLVLTGEEAPYQAPGASDPNYQAADSTAVPAVGESALASGGEEAFLRNANTNTAQKDIRAVLNTENRPIIAEEKKPKSFLDKLQDTGEGKDPVVDAQKERERIEINKETGKPITTGDTPTTKPEQKTTLQKIFE